MEDNYLLEQRRFNRITATFVDTNFKSYKEIFLKHKLKFKVLGLFKHKNNAYCDYILVVIKFRNTDSNIKKFFESMEELKNKRIIVDSNYMNVCKDLFTDIFIHK